MTERRIEADGYAGRQRRRLTATEVDLGVVRQRALLVGGGDVSLDEAEASLAELALLTDTAGAEPVALEMQRRETPDPATFIGKGKAEELRELVEMLDLDLVIFDEELSPAQQRNLEKLFKVDVVDRVALILDIFAQHAHSQAGMLQVELAQLRYRLPRLRGRGVQMSQQGAGAGRGGGLIGTRGPGETQLEVDRRRILRTDLEAGARPGRRLPGARHAAQGPPPGRPSAGGPGRLHQRRQVDAPQPADRCRRPGGGPAVLHPRRHRPAPGPARRRDRAPLRHRRVRPQAAPPAGRVVPVHAGGGGRRRPPRPRRRRLLAGGGTPDRRGAGRAARAGRRGDPRTARGQQARRRRPRGAGGAEGSGGGAGLGRHRRRHRRLLGRRWPNGSGP